MIPYVKLRIVLPFLILLAAIASTVHTNYAMEHPRLLFCYWVRKIFPTHTTIQTRESLFHEYPPQKKLTEQEDFKNHIQEAFEKFKLEHEETKSLLRGDANDITKDAWGRDLYFTFDTSRGRECEIISAGEDGLFNSDDDISSHDDTKSTLINHNTARRRSAIWFSLSVILFTISFSMFLRRLKRGIRGFYIILVSAFLLFFGSLLMPCVDPSWAVPHYLPITFLQVILVSGIFTGIFQMARGKKKCI